MSYAVRLANRRYTEEQIFRAFAAKPSEHELPEAERLRRAEAKRKEHFARLAYKSARVRRERAAERRASR